MIGDSKVISEEYMSLAKKAYAQIKNHIDSGRTYSISIAGESGCGKTSLGLNLVHLYRQEQKEVDLYHQDDYFHLPPQDNHSARLKDITHVGPQEVDLKLLQEHVAASKQNKSQIIKPLIDYTANSITTETLDSSLSNVVIVEGTYASLLRGIDIKIFMDKTYLQTKEARYTRARDVLSPFNEQVLAIEHDIIKTHKSKCLIWIDHQDELHLNETYSLQG